MGLTILSFHIDLFKKYFPRDPRYRTAAENIDFLPTILSRFDMIFIVRDIRDEAKDMAIAKHVMGVHVNANTKYNLLYRLHFVLSY